MRSLTITIALQEPASSSPASVLAPRNAASSTLAQRQVLGDVSNASFSSLAARDHNGARRQGRKPGQNNFEKNSDLPARAKSTRQRSVSVPVDRAAAPFARPAVTATRAASIRAVTAPTTLTSSRSAPPRRGELTARPAPRSSTAPLPHPLDQTDRNPSSCVLGAVVPEVGAKDAGERPGLPTSAAELGS